MLQPFFRAFGRIDVLRSRQDSGDTIRRAAIMVNSLFWL